MKKTNSGYVFIYTTSFLVIWTERDNYWRLEHKEMS